VATCILGRGQVDLRCEHSIVIEQGVAGCSKTHSWKVKRTGHRTSSLSAVGAHVSAWREAVVSIKSNIKSNAEHKRIVRRYYEDVLQQHNLAALDDIFAPDFVGHSTAYGTYALTDMRRDIGRGRATMPDDETIIEEQLAEGDCVVTRWRYRWRHDQSVFGE